MTWLKKIWNMRMYFFFSLYVAICFPLIPLPVKQKIYLFVPSSSYVKNPQLPPLVWPSTRKVTIYAVQLNVTSRLLYSWYYILYADLFSLPLTFNCNILINYENLVRVSISTLSDYLPSYVKNPWSHFSVSLGKYIFFLIPMGYSGM